MGGLSEGIYLDRVISFIHGQEGNCYLVMYGHDIRIVCDC
jgi:hypothetical protein